MSRPEKLSHYAVVLIAVSALVVSVWQVKISQQHNKLSVRPYLDYLISATEERTQLSISNEGFGPAILTEISYFYNGKQYDNWNSLMNDAGQNHRIRGVYNFSENTVFAAGAKITLLTMVDDNENEVIVEVRIVYKSIYDEFQTPLKFSFRI